MTTWRILACSQEIYILHDLFMTYFIKDDLDLFVGSIEGFERSMDGGVDEGFIVVNFQTVLVTSSDGYVTVTWKYEPSSLYI